MTIKDFFQYNQTHYINNVNIHYCNDYFLLNEINSSGKIIFTKTFLLYHNYFYFMTKKEEKKYASLLQDKNYYIAYRINKKFFIIDKINSYLLYELKKDNYIALSFTLDNCHNTLFFYEKRNLKSYYNDIIEGIQIINHYKSPLLFLNELKN